MASSARQKAMANKPQFKSGRGKMPKNLSCDWSTRFMKVIVLGLSLVRIRLLYRCTETGLQ